MLQAQAVPPGRPIQTGPGRVNAAPPAKKSFTAHPASAASARAHVRHVLAGRVVCLDDAELLADELFANAIQHSRSGGVPPGEVTVGVAVYGDRVRVEVEDAGPLNGNRPTVRDSGASSDVVSGRGLLLVARLAATWGWRAASSPGCGTVVWFELARSV